MRAFFILFILLGFPVLEFTVTARVAQLIGWWLLPWLFVSAVVGVRLIGAAGPRVPARLLAALNSGYTPSFALLYSFRSVLAGLLLILPGVVSDFLALLLLLLPPPKEPHRPDDGVIEGEWKRVDDNNG